MFRHFEEYFGCAVREDWEDQKGSSRFLDCRVGYDGKVTPEPRNVQNRHSFP